MRILPAIDLRRGKVVQLVGGDPADVAVRSDHTPAEQANLWREAGASALHVIDLDAALGGANQWLHLGRIIQTGLPVQFGGGVRSMVDIQRLLDLGVDKIIVGTQGVHNPAWLRELCVLWPGRIIFAVDAFGRDVAVKGWTEKTGLDVVELARSLDDAGLAGFLFTNVEKEGRLQGIDPTVLQDLRDATPATPLIASGGISTDADLDTLADIGIDACVLGMSIYTGRINLGAAIQRHEAKA